MKHRAAAFKNAKGFITAIAGSAAVTFLFYSVFPEVESATIIVSYLLVVLISSTSGLAAGLFASLLGIVSLAYFFFPPILNININTQRHWIEAAAFVITAIVVSKLSAKARMEATEAKRRGEELSKLYRLSSSVLSGIDLNTNPKIVAEQVLRSFPEISACAIVVNGNPNHVFSSRRDTAHEFDSIAHHYEEEIADLKISRKIDLPNDETLHLIPVSSGTGNQAAMMLLSDRLQASIAEAIGNQVGLALEKTSLLNEISITEALRQNDEFKSAILASISHSLRTPLTSIRAALDHLMQTDSGLDQESARELHSIVQEETEKLSRLIADLLQMARIEANQLQSIKEWCQLPDIISSVMDRCGGALQHHRLTLDFDESMPLLLIDQKLISEVLANLLENAARFSQPGTEIIIQAALNNESLQINILDRGKGIPPENIDRIFDKFYQSSDSRGTGMGLAIARGIVNACGGSISAVNRPGGGAIFSFHVPVSTREVAALTAGDME